MLRFGNRLSIAFLALALMAGQAGVCAGWMETPEARMACCSQHGPCPMHESHSEDDAPTRAVSQAEADRCCAASEQEDSAPSPAGPAFSVTPAVALDAAPALLREPEYSPDFWRASRPLTPSHVPKHLLLSVFLV